MAVSLAIRMFVAHAIGIFVLSIVGVVMGSDPDLGEFIGVFLVSLIASLFVFLPVMLVAMAHSEQIFEDPIRFTVAGPIVLMILAGLFAGRDWSIGIGLCAGVSSLVLYLSIWIDNPIDLGVAD